MATMTPEEIDRLWDFDEPAHTPCPFTDEQVLAIGKTLYAPNHPSHYTPDELRLLQWQAANPDANDALRARLKGRTSESSGVHKHVCPCCSKELVCTTPGCEASPVPAKQRRLTAEELALMLKLRTAGASINGLAKHFNVSRPTIQRRLELMGARYHE